MIATHVQGQPLSSVHSLQSRCVRRRCLAIHKLLALDMSASALLTSDGSTRYLERGDARDDGGGDGEPHVCG